MQDLVSIIMPSYNTEAFIKETIQSVLNQTYTNWELLIVDDCSSDSTIKVIEQFQDDNRIRLLQNETNQGAALSRNRALREARGRWIAFLDSDDLWYPEKLEKQIDFMERNQIFFSYTECEKVDENGKSLGIKISGPRRVTKKGMYRYCWPGCLTVMYDQEVIGTIQIRDIRKNNDYAMWLKVCQKADCYLLPEVLASYRRRPGSISNHGYLKLIKWHYRLFRDAEGKGALYSLYATGRNLVFGTYKKIHYVRKMPIKQEETTGRKIPSMIE